MTRTYFRKGRTTAQMKLIYDIVSRVQSEAAKEYTWNSTWSRVVETAASTLTKLLMKHDFLIGDYEELMKEKMYTAFMPHGLGHPVGNVILKA